MPPQQGEVTLFSVAADVHYFFSPPTQHPLHHRFQKTSYLYIYKDPAQSHGRLEIANAPGTPEQDAVAGSLATADISSPSNRPTFLTVTLKPDTTQWQLPSYDLRNERKYLYPLHSLDIYFWTPEDTQEFLRCIKPIPQTTDIHSEGPPKQVQAYTTEASAVERPEHHERTSAVVQKLEKAAIDTPYQHESHGALHGPGSPRVPIPAETAPAAYAPLAYNPAAPATPETIAHRERTPPPVDGENGIGVGGGGRGPRSSSLPQGYPYSGQQRALTGSYYGAPSQLQTSSSPALPPPLQQQQSFSIPLAPTSSFAAPTRTLSFPPPPPPPSTANIPASPPPPATQFQHQPYTPSFTPASPDPKYTQPYTPLAPQPPGFPPPPAPPQTQTPTHPTFSPPPPPPQDTPTHTFPSQPPSQTPNPPIFSPHETHTQIYLPTDAELSAKSGGGHGGKTAGNGEKKQGRMEQRAEKVEKGVNRFLRMLDGRI